MVSSSASAKSRRAHKKVGAGCTPAVASLCCLCMCCASEAAMASACTARSSRTPLELNTKKEDRSTANAKSLASCSRSLWVLPVPSQSRSKQTPPSLPDPGLEACTQIPAVQALTLSPTAKLAFAPCVPANRFKSKDLPVRYKPQTATTFAGRSPAAFNRARFVSSLTTSLGAPEAPFPDSSKATSCSGGLSSDHTGRASPLDAAVPPDAIQQRLLPSLPCKRGPYSMLAMPP
mmetsp:Transcript_6281/g.11503  ORF Transcript_6281/g.11503 Transcript_6281/m.11503 type:complete len:233 (+) Transcript_6281:560-1258(+)